MPNQVHQIGRVLTVVYCESGSGKDRDQRLLGRLEFAPFAVRTGLAAGGKRIRTVGPLTEMTDVGTPGSTAPG